MASRILCQSSQQHGDGTLGFLTSWSISCPAENENNENNIFRRGSAVLRPVAAVRGCMEAVLAATHEWVFSNTKYFLIPALKLLHKAESLVCGHRLGVFTWGWRARFSQARALAAKANICSASQAPTVRCDEVQETSKARQSALFIRS